MQDAATDPKTPLRAGSVGGVLASLGWLLSGRGVAAALSLVYIAMITRTLGLEGFGQFTLIVGTAQTITALVSFQTWQIVVRYGMEHLHQGRMAALVRLVKACLAFDVVAALMGAVLAVAAVALLAPRFGWTDRIQGYALLFCFVSLLAVRSTAVGVLRLYGRFNVAALADTAMPISRLVGALTALAFAPRLEGFVIAWIAADLVAATAFWIAALATLKGLPWRAGKLSAAQVRQENPGIIGLAGMTNASQSFSLIGKQGAVLLVGLLASPAAAGGFRLAHQLGMSMAKVGQMLSTAVFPELMRARTVSGDPEHFRRLLTRTVAIASAAGGCIFLLLLLAGKPLLGLIAGREFVYVYPLLLILGSAAIVDFVAVSFAPALIAAGRAATAFRIELMVALILLGLLVGLLDRFGPTGAAAALLTGSLASAALMATATLRTLRRDDPEVSASDAAIVAGRSADVDQPGSLG